MYTLLDVCIVIRGFLMPRVHYYIMNGFEATDLLGEIPMRKQMLTPRFTPYGVSSQLIMSYNIIFNGMECFQIYFNYFTLMFAPHVHLDLYVVPTTLSGRAATYVLMCPESTGL